MFNNLLRDDRSLLTCGDYLYLELTVSPSILSSLTSFITVVFVETLQTQLIFLHICRWLILVIDSEAPEVLHHVSM